MINLELYELKNICKDMAELGAANYAKRMAPAEDNISQREAYRIFGEARVKNWRKRDLIKNLIRSGSSERSKLLYSYAELLSLITAENMNKAINK